MPTFKANSFADVMQDWEGLLVALRENAALLSGVDSYRDSLESLLAQARALKGRQETHAGQRQMTTQEISVLVLQGLELTRSIRSIVRGQIGAKNELLTQFKVSPLRRRPRTFVEAKALPQQEKAAPPPETPEGAAS